MAQWIKVLATKPDDLNSITGPTPQKERTNSPNLIYDLHMHTVISTNRQISNKCNLKLLKKE